MQGLRYLSVLIGTLAIAAGVAQLGIEFSWSMGTFTGVLIVALVVWLPVGGLIVGGLPERWKRRHPASPETPDDDGAPQD